MSWPNIGSFSAYSGSAAARLQFGPLALEAVRQVMIDASLARGVINQRVFRIKPIFK